MPTKFLDTFTDGDGVLLENHVADYPVGEGWLGFPGSAHLLKILGNECVDGWAGIDQYWTSTDGVGGGIAYAIGDEIKCDIERYGTGFENGVAFLGNAASDEILIAFLIGEDAANCVVGAARKSGAGTHDQISSLVATMPRVPCVDGAAVQFGVIIRSALTFQFFWEPVGGGFRTYLDLDDGLPPTAGGVWNPTLDFLDAAHDRVGLWTQFSGAPGVNNYNRNNLRVTDDATPWTPPTPPPGLTSWGDC